MDIRKDKFLASLLAFGVMGAAACGGGAEEGTEAEAAPMTTGGDETMAEPAEPMGMEEPPMEDPGMGEDTGMEEEGDLGPTPE